MSTLVPVVLDISTGESKHRELDPGQLQSLLAAVSLVEGSSVSGLH